MSHTNVDIPDSMVIANSSKIYIFWSSIEKQNGKKGEGRNLGQEIGRK